MICEITSKSCGEAPMISEFVLPSAVTWICCAASTAPVNLMLDRAISSDLATSFASAFLR